jgi:lipoate---protein ligase
VGGWEVRRLRGAAAALHAEPMPAEPTRSVWVLEADAPALVLGSTQADELVDHAAAVRRRIEVARRRSGGGVVLVDPATTAWVDVIVPVGDPLWDDDVGRAAHWVGAVWQAALADLGVAPTEVHTAALACGPLGRLVCFGTVGAGEVTTPEGRKVVGVSQRRTRLAARFQCAAYSRWAPEPVSDLLRIDAEGAAALADAAIGTGRSPAEMVEAFVRQLPR